MAAMITKPNFIADNDTQLIAKKQSGVENF